MKAGSLTLWMQACKDARAALKAEGYAGSLNLKRGGPMHTKALDLLKDRTAASSSSSCGSSTAAVATESAPVPQAGFKGD